MNLVLLHRDLRLEDNTALNAALKDGPTLVAFFFTPIQTSKNQLFSSNSFQFLLESLRELPEVYLDYGSDSECLERLLAQKPFTRIYFNQDYTPYAKRRDQQITQWAESRGIEIYPSLDYTLVDLSTVQTQKGTPYQVFKFFYDKVKVREIPAPTGRATGELISLNSPIELQGFKLVRSGKVVFEITPNDQIAVHGGRKSGLTQLNQTELFQNYEQTRDFPEYATTLLSAHIKFGTVSIREVYQAFKPYTELTRQLIWHDFYANLVEAYPDRTLGEMEGESYGNWRGMDIPWTNNQEYWNSWITGSTGYPIVDAGIRQMLATGWMHNQARMVVANVLSVGFLIDWHWGEDFFAQNLVDYDPSSNNGNWQWAAQVGTDRPRSYPRVYNPFTFAKKHDPEAVYIKRWIPELKDVPAKDIHTWDKTWENHDNDYPEPIANLSELWEQHKPIFKESQ